MNQANYKLTTQTAIFQGKTIIVTHLTPVLTAEQQAKRKDEIERQLYDVFVKYAGRRMG